MTYINKWINEKVATEDAKQQQQQTITLMPTRRPTATKTPAQSSNPFQQALASGKKIIFSTC